MRILHVIDSLVVGGAERLLLSTIAHSPEQEHFVVSLSDQVPLAEELPATVQLTKLGFRGKGDTIRCVRAIRRLIRKEGIDVVHSHLVLANLLARLATPSQVPLFNSLHNLNGEKIFFRRWSLATILEKLFYRKHHHLIAVSKAVLDDYQKYIGLKGPATVLHNFVEDRFFAAEPKRYQPHGTLRLLAVGSLKAQKNYDYLLEALRHVPEGCSLDIYGQGPLMASLQQKIDNNSLPVRLLGNHPRIDTVMPEYDLYVMCSTHEGHPIALVEAMAAGMPAVVSDIPVLREAMGDRGLYFDLRDPSSLAQLLTSIHDGRLGLDEYASYNWQLAQATARKEAYLKKLFELYKNPHQSNQHTL